MTERAFTPICKLTPTEIENLFWSMKDSKDEESAIAVLNGHGFNVFERLLVIFDLIRFGKFVEERDHDGTSMRDTGVS